MLGFVQLFEMRDQSREKDRDWYLYCETYRITKVNPKILLSEEQKVMQFVVFVPFLRNMSSHQDKLFRKTRQLFILHQ